MAEHYLYHGARGDEILSILASGAIEPNEQGLVYFGRFDWRNVLQHGADRHLRASFAVQARVEIPETVLQESRRIETPGVPDTLELTTRQPLRATVLTLYIRERTDDGFEVKQISGDRQIREELERRRAAAPAR